MYVCIYMCITPLYSQRPNEKWIPPFKGIIEDF